MLLSAAVLSNFEVRAMSSKNVKKAIIERVLTIAGLTVLAYAEWHCEEHKTTSHVHKRSRTHLSSPFISFLDANSSRSCQLLLAANQASHCPTRTRQEWSPQIIFVLSLTPQGLSATRKTISLTIWLPNYPTIASRRFSSPPGAGGKSATSVGDVPARPWCTNTAGRSTCEEGRVEGVLV